jgi:preprotein translocase subunit YajC
MNNMWILAEAGKELGAPTGPVEIENTGELTKNVGDEVDPDANVGDKLGNMPMLFIFGGLALMMLFMSRGNKKKQKKHQTMVKSLQKNDKIRTVGGIIGTVLDVRDDEIVIKIDETNNTKMKVIPSAIASTLSEDTK